MSARARFAVEHRRERMRREMDRRACRRRSPRLDRGCDFGAIRPIVLVENPLALVARQRARDRREQRAMMFGSIQVDEQARRLADDQRRVERLRELPRQRQRAGIPTAVRIEQRAMRGEGFRIARRDSIAAVFARDEEADVSRRHETSAPRRGNRTTVDSVASSDAAFTFGSDRPQQAASQACLR